MASYKRTTITVPDEVMDEAHEYGINISAASVNGIKAAIEREKKIRELGL